MKVTQAEYHADSADCMRRAKAAGESLEVMRPDGGRLIISHRRKALDDCCDEARKDERRRIANRLRELASEVGGDVRAAIALKGAADELHPG